MKTAITVLQEIMMKLGEIPVYECISQAGPHHQSTFEFQCAAHGETATAVARSKKEAKQESARLVLARLAARGLAVPPPWGQGGQARVPPEAEAERPPGPDLRSYVALLKELCEEFALPAVEYELVGDTGPPHLRHFTVRARIGQHARLATGSTKKGARQQAAEDLYLYLRENIRRTRDFVEEEALVRAHERAMERYREARTLDGQPRLAQRLADYHLGLQEQFEEGPRALAVEALESTRAQPPEVALGCAAGALGLALGWDSLPRAAEPEPLHVLTLAPSTPPLAFAGASRAAAAAAAVRYLARALPDLHA